MRKIALSLACCAVVFALDPTVNKTKGAGLYTGAELDWVVPDVFDDEGYIIPEKMPKGSKWAEAVILGNRIMNETSYFIGPKAPEGKRYAGNNLNCSSCHAEGGTVPNEAGYVGIHARFPQYLARGDVVATIENRINGCMQRSMNGKPIPFNSPEMKAMVTYFQFLSQGVPVGAKVKGQGLPKIELLKRAADPAKGKKVYEENCASCHGENGEGTRNYETDDEARAANFRGGVYAYGPLWGDDSYNTGAGMYRLLKAAQYIHANMPKGDAHLSLEEAYDVAAYINTQPRPVLEGRENDFPDRATKPLDMDVPPYDDTFSIKQHRFGPYGEMKKQSLQREGKAPATPKK